jgi:DNA-binding NarL/FixJ family response regulator
MMPGRPRVLLAEDHAGVAKALIEVLEPHCDVIGLVTDGREAVEQALQLCPVIAIVDVGLPTVNGLDICRQITKSNRDAKVILISGMLDDSIIEEALAAGAADCIHKARAASELVVAIQDAWTQPA